MPVLSSLFAALSVIDMLTSYRVKCDRQLPCGTCSSRGIGISCTYRSRELRKNKISVGDRIQQLETLVRSLAASQQTPQSAGSPSPSPAPNPPPLVDEEAVLSTLDHASPAPSQYGSIRRHSHGTNYVGSVHWAAVLDSISELRDHYEEEEEARLLATGDHAPYESPGPRLLYEPIQATRADVLASIPPRPAVDRMVARYFNSQSVVPDILHSSQFLREYESFWKEPAAVSLIWIGLLFSVMCLSTLYQQSTEDPADPETLIRMHLFREQSVNCLVLGQYTRGGDYVLETMINYLTCEMILAKDAEVDLWLIEGMLVQLALSLGYHRDAKNFPSISPFAGEMRRRVWATVVQIDLRLSSQMVLPRLLKLQQYDTAEPRNLLDSDFDETTTELPPARPETEVTPVLYGLAKGRIDKMNGLISDLINNTNSAEPPYSEVLELDRKLQEAEASLPPIFRWQPLHQSFMVLPQIVMHRVLLQLAIQRLVIWLHRQYLSPSHSEAQHKYSQNACIQAAIKILELQMIVDEETKRDGLLYPVRWMFTTSRPQAVFLLGISILCYYIQLIKIQPDITLHQETNEKIYTLLHTTYPLWVRLSIVSRGAQRVVEHLGHQLGLRGPPARDTSFAATSAVESSPAAIAQDNFISLDKFIWESSEEYVGGFPAVADFPAGLIDSDTPGSSSVMSFSMLDIPSSIPPNWTGR
ncbi:hypothetical protein F4859DRAFT_524113 [Xylaria cf. heliscus]|nr:hypothetical protein F4859DRAFT_524113 [Xylaria cf. heliscus]